MTEPKPRSLLAKVVRFFVTLGLLAIIGYCMRGLFLPHSASHPVWVRNQSAAASCLRNLHIDETVMRMNDLDGNGLADFWTGDWSGFYRLEGQEERLMDRDRLPRARADADPLPPSDGPRPRLGPKLEPLPYRGYWFRALARKDGVALAQDGPDQDKHAWENPEAYAFAAFPAEYGESGRLTFVTSEDGVIWAKDLGPRGGDALREWPEWPLPKGASPESQGWRKRE